MACVPVVSSNNAFNYLDTAGGLVLKSWNNISDPSAYKAFNGTLTDGTKMGQITYLNYNNVEELSCLPDGTTTPTSLIIHFPTAITPTAFAACFRVNETDATPKVWQFEGTNGDYTDSATVWTPLTSSSAETWNQSQIKTFNISDSAAYTTFRFIFNITSTTINNYIENEETDADGVTMPINCYYFQIYATNTSSSIKGNIVEGYVKPNNMSMGSYFLDISKKPYTGYKCTGANAFTPVNYVKLGFVNATGIGTINPVITCYPFCYNTFAGSGDISVSKNTEIEFLHNLGLIPNIIDIKFVCLIANNGYSVGDYINNIYASETQGLISIRDSVLTTVTQVKLWPGTASSTLYVRNKSTHVLGSISNGQWAAIIYCSRGW